MNNENVVNLIKCLGDYNVSTTELLNMIERVPADDFYYNVIKSAITKQVAIVTKLMEVVCGTTLDKH